jgi:hypothetical protein
MEGCLHVSIHLLGGRLAIRSDGGDGSYGQVGGGPKALADWSVTLRLLGQMPQPSRPFRLDRSHSNPACIGPSEFAWALRSSDSQRVV